MFGIVGLFVVFLSLPAAAATWVVHADGSGSAPTIPGAMALAAAGDTVLVTPGVYTDLVQDPFDHWVGVTMTSGVVLLSTDGPAVTRIDVTDAALSTRGVSCPQASASTVIEGFTITGADGFEGAAVWIQGGSPTLRNNVFLDAFGGQAGSVFVGFGAVTDHRGQCLRQQLRLLWVRRGSVRSGRNGGDPWQRFPRMLVRHQRGRDRHAERGRHDQRKPVRGERRRVRGRDFPGEL
jgi:hypothetical protein